MERDWDDISEIKRKAAAKEEKKPEVQKAEIPQQEVKIEKKEPKPSVEEGPAAVLEEMKAAGITGALVRADGVLVHSTMPLSDSGAGLLASVSNVSDALMKRVNDTPKELEITFQSQILVIIPIDGYLFCGIVKDREKKKTIRDYAAKAKAAI